MTELPPDKQPLLIHSVDVSHSRLVDLAALADLALPFYNWVEEEFQRELRRPDALDILLRTGTAAEIERAILLCYSGGRGSPLPLLFDGIGRSYTHSRACYYFFAWLVRDAPQQRLGPLIARIARSSDVRRSAIEAHVLAALITKYRSNLKTFAWEAVREVLIDRLEGSRRSIRGREKEVIARTALLAAVQRFFATHDNYGMYAQVEIPDGQVTIGNETFDVSANLMNDRGQVVRSILMPVKTRETEGGGHAHLFTRDITAAINATKSERPQDFLIVVIVARNWSAREAENVREMADHAVIFDIDPNQFSDFGQAEQKNLDEFVELVLAAAVTPKRAN